MQNPCMLPPERVALRNRLDAEPDFTTEGGSIGFNQRFVTTASEGAFACAPQHVVDAARSLLSAAVGTSVAAIVHDTVVFAIGCSRVPVFALVDGGRGRTLFSFRCVFAGCASFLDVRLFSGVARVKWVLMNTSHSHDFTHFPERMPRNTFPEDVVRQMADAVASGVSCAEVKMRFDVLCSKHVFQNAVRGTRVCGRSDQSRSLRDVARESNVWASEIHISETNEFVEAFFANAVVASKDIGVRLVYVDDTASTNAFGFPVIAVLCRDAASNVHSIAWGC